MRKEFVDICNAVCVFRLLKPQLICFNFAEFNDNGILSNYFISNFLHSAINTRRKHELVR